MSHSFKLPKPVVLSPVGSRNKFPIYVVVICIIGFLFSLIRVGLAITGMLSLTELPVGHPLAFSAPLEIVCAAIIGLFGIMGYSMMLARVRTGAFLAMIAQIGVIGSIAISAMQLPIVLAADGAQQTQAIATYGGFGLVVLIRLGIMVAVIIGIKQFSQWHKSQDSSEPIWVQSV